MKIVILGATRGMGRELARLAAARKDEVFLLGRDEEALRLSATDVGIRTHGGAPAWALCDLEQPSTFEPALAAAETALGGLDVVVVTAALFGTQEQLEADRDLLRRVLTVNFAHTLLFCEIARERLLARGGGRLVVFSSVAGERGRKPVVLYGAAKAGLSAYLEGLDHRYHGQGLQVITVKPGFVKTGMTAGLQPPPFAGEADQVARDVLAVIDNPRPVIYTPAIWGPIMAVIRLLPRAVMRRIGF